MRGEQGCVHANYEWTKKQVMESLKIVTVQNETGICTGLPIDDHENPTLQRRMSGL